MKVTAIILAAGKGSRMKSDIKKQYMLIQGKTVLWHSVRAFEESSVDEIVLVIAKEDMEYCKELIEQSSFRKISQIVEGGMERYDSVYAGLIVSGGSDYVMIHDGARPLITKEVIEKCIESVKLYQACIVGVPVKDTIKIADREGRVQKTPAREDLWAIQTPQAFSYPLILKSYQKMYQEQKGNVTDDSMVVEQYSDCKVHIVEGEYTNIKITTKDDLITAEKFFEKVEKKC